MEIGCARPMLARWEGGERPRRTLYRRLLAAWIAGKWNAREWTREEN